MPSVQDQVIDFYYALFERVFTQPFQVQIAERLKRDSVTRQVEDAAGAASQSLTRFLLNEQLSEIDTASLLKGFGPLRDLLDLEDVANPNVPPETVVNDLLGKLPCPAQVRSAGKDAVYRLALHSIVQVLMLVGPVLVEWKKANFSGTFEPSRRIVSKLNQISEQLGALGSSGQDAADERYDLSYRDRLLQRFHRIEAGTVRMTTSQDVSLAELFVTPRVLARKPSAETDRGTETPKQEFMDLEAARRRYATDTDDKPAAPREDGVTAVDQVRLRNRNVLVGAPGGGKSTFLEWLQLKLAGGEEKLPLGGQQALPLLLRVRQLNPQDLPNGSKLIEKATGSKDFPNLMPQGWIERQLKHGRVFFMLDGLDEVEPDFRDNKLLPWFEGICREYPQCRYLVSSRPEGYPPGTLKRLEFVECDLLDFDESQVAEYARHWCTAVRLARNEPETEARREGEIEGERIVDGFKEHPYTRNLARNPLMLSAICLVNYFEGGQLPKDRAMLYGLCVEGLLHNWDQRRGILSEFGFEEKLRACREVAVRMQADNRAEYEAPKVQAIFESVLGDQARAKRLLEHIRRRTGLLLERRPSVFAFAHLTFQEYLAARAVHEGNRTGVDAKRLTDEHDDGRWKEVIALYCGLVPAPDAREMIEDLIARDDSRSLGDVLTEAYLSAGPEIAKDATLRKRVIERIAVATGFWPSPLQRFLTEEVSPIANSMVGTVQGSLGLVGAHRWLATNPKHIEDSELFARLKEWRGMSPSQLAELIHLLHYAGADKLLAALSENAEIYSAPGPNFVNRKWGMKGRYATQAETAAIGLSSRFNERISSYTGTWKALLQIFRTVTDPHFYAPDETTNSETLQALENISRLSKKRSIPQNAAIRDDLLSAIRKFTERVAANPNLKSHADTFRSWADLLQHGTKTEHQQVSKGARKRRKGVAAKVNKHDKTS